MNEFLSSGAGITHKKYYRLMIIACLDTLFNVPVLITNLVTDILQGQDNGLNYLYISWENVHNGAGGNLPGLSLSAQLYPSDASQRMEYRQMEYVRSEVGQMGLRPPCNHVLHCLRYNSRDVPILPIRALVHSGPTWVQETACFRSGDSF